MYGIGDKVVYSAQGVMEIVDITDQEFGDVTRRYYVMKEYASASPSLTYVPFDNETLVGQMKPLLTKEEIVEVVRAAKNSEPLEWIEENRARAEAYKRILASADRGMILSMIRSVYLTGKRREAEGKKNYIADENIMKKAEKQISVEFSLVLGISEGEMRAFIDSI